MTDLLTAVGKHISRSMPKECPERMKMELFMYNEVDRRTKPYRDWIAGKLTLSEAYKEAGGKECVTD